jgi:hypothetical protein
LRFDLFYDGLMSDSSPHDGTKDQRYYEELLALRFPSIAGTLTEIERGLLHMEMGTFAMATRNAIESERTEEVAAHLAFVDELFGRAAPDLDNAIYVSYLENVFLGRDDARYRRARSTLSDRLRAGFVELEEGWKEFDARQRERPLTGRSGDRKDAWAMQTSNWWRLSNPDGISDFDSIPSPEHNL